jgi:hypothetical protein
MTEDPYIPKGKDIITTNGCRCKSTYKTESGAVYEDSCNLVDATDPWCIVEEKCGQVVSEGNLKGKWWDKCTATSQGDDNITYGKEYFSQNLKGIVVYIVIFVITIPILLYRYGFHKLLEVYMPNFDLLATAVSFGGGPGDSRIFQELYNSNSQNLLGQTSTLFINYLSLLGLTYLVARRVHITKSLAKGWGIGFVMLFLTYLVPNDIISSIQHRFSETFFGHKTGENKTITTYLSIVAIGLCIAAMFIGIELTILDRHKTWLDPFVKHVLHITDFFDKIFKM